MKESEGEKLKYANRKIPIGFCPTCNRPIIYSCNGKDKNNIIVSRADDDYMGRTYLCAKCKTMVAIVEKRSQDVSLPVTANA